MAGRAASLAAISGVAVAFLFGGLSTLGGDSFATAFLIGSLSAASSFTLAMAIFYFTMPRMNQRLAVFWSLSLGAIAAFVVGYLLQPVSGPA